MDDGIFDQPLAAGVSRYRSRRRSRRSSAPSSAHVAGCHASRRNRSRRSRRYAGPSGRGVGAVLADVAIPAAPAVRDDLDALERSSWTGRRREIPLRPMPWMLRSCSHTLLEALPLDATRPSCRRADARGGGGGMAVDAVAPVGDLKVADFDVGAAVEVEHAQCRRRPPASAQWRRCRGCGSAPWRSGRWGPCRSSRTRVAGGAAAGHAGRTVADHVFAGTDISVSPPAMRGVPLFGRA